MRGGEGTVLKALAVVTLMAVVAGPATALADEISAGELAVLLEAIRQAQEEARKTQDARQARKHPPPVHPRGTADHHSQ